MEIRKVDDLPNKPLVEALLEIKWGRPDQPDPAYPMVVGRLYERVQEDYPFIEDLPLAAAPPQIVVQSVRHRFRRAEGAWPLVQVGPGIATLNDTEGYTREDFLARAKLLPDHIRDSMPPSCGAPEFTSLLLQYIDAFPFDYQSHDVRDFLSGKLQIDLSVPTTLFEGQPVADRPSMVMLQLACVTANPPGQVELRITTGIRDSTPVVVLHTTVSTTESDAQVAAQDFEGWLRAAHAITHHWFFALIQGDLLEAFEKR